MRRGSTVLPEASVLERGIGADFAGAEKERAPGAEMRRRAALMNFILVDLLESTEVLPTDEMVALLTSFCKIFKRDFCNVEDGRM